MCGLPWQAKVAYGQEEPYQPAPLSPRPCTQMIVAVFLRTAGTTIAAALDCMGYGGAGDEEG